MSEEKNKEQEIEQYQDMSNNNDDFEKWWPKPNTPEKVDLDLGHGVTVTWVTSNGQLCGGIITHPEPNNENGQCWSHFWLADTDYTRNRREKGPVWKMTGSLDKPTLEPSFLCHCKKSHGFIRNGEWIPA